MTPENGRYGTAEYQASGQQTAQAIYSAFSKRVVRVSLSTQKPSYENQLELAQTHNFTYLVQPEILHWEERATEWSGKPDRIEVKISIVQVETGKTIDSVTVKGKSKWGTFGGDHPQDLLPKPIDDYVDSLF